MLYIKKGTMPSGMRTEVTKIRRSKDWQKIEPKNTKAVRDYFDRLPKSEIRTALLQEQKGICAYCMRRVLNDMHTSIEHWSPLSKDKENALNYKNMLAVCDGGKSWSGTGKKILSCDAQKGDTEELTISPYNQQHMSKIAYKSDGTIYTEPYDSKLESDINKILVLNGNLDQEGHMLSDTATELVKGRKDAYLSCRRFFKELDKRGKCTSIMVKKRIDMLKNSETLPEFAGVSLFFLERKYTELKRRGL